MQFKEIWQKYQLQDASSQGIIAQEVQNQSINTDNPIVSNAFIAESGSFLAFVVFWAGILVIATRKLKSLSEHLEPMNDCANLPCIKCHYFARNQYVKCAVQPSIALTKQANTCADYHPKREVEIRE